MICYVTAVIEMATAATETYTQEKITSLLVRYWGLGKGLNNTEKEVLLAALDEENKQLRGEIHIRALDRLKEQGIS